MLGEQTGQILGLAKKLDAFTLCSQNLLIRDKRLHSEHYIQLIRIIHRIFHRRCRWWRQLERGTWEVIERNMMAVLIDVRGRIITYCRTDHCQWGELASICREERKFIYFDGVHEVCLEDNHIRGTLRETWRWRRTFVGRYLQKHSCKKRWHEPGKA